jgi:tetratricopeptide (TPR) repeat protein
MVRTPKDPVIVAPNISKEEELIKFKKSIRGLISYFDMNGDSTKFPKVTDTQEFIKTPMSQIQFEKYVEAFKAIKAEQKNYDKLAKQNQINKYWEPARKYSNMLFNFDKDMALSDFSCKIPYLISNIQKYPLEKQYAYSAFYTKMGYGGQGVVAIAKELEKVGYTKLTVAEARKLNKAKKLPEKGLRYILVISTELSENGDAGANLAELLKIYNHAENRYGELIHIMLASQSYYTALDLKCVRHIHIVEPFVSMLGDIQVIGRACRNCSHADLPMSQWTVTIHRYMSEKPITIAIDNGPKKQIINEAIAELENQLESLNDKEILKELKKLLKEKEKQFKAVSKLLEKKKATEEEVYEIQQEIKNITDKINNAQNDIDNNKDVSVKIKQQIKEKQKELKLLDKPPKYQPNDIEIIEERIFKESRERIKELLTIYQSMREAAIDCRAMNVFHKSTGNDIVCEDFK